MNHFNKICFPLIACCPTLNVVFENDVKDQWAVMQGTYTFQGFNDGLDYWVDAEGDYAIWWHIYHVESMNGEWRIGFLLDLLSGNKQRIIHSKSHTLHMCPNNEGYVLNWHYKDQYTNSYIDAANDINIKCAYENDFCTSENSCGTNEGDCDAHDECQDDLACGSNNCPQNLEFHTEYDCCYAPAVGDKHYCTTNNPCAVDEGDCDSKNECQENLFCELMNSCPSHLGFASDMNCCSSGSGCKIYQITLTLL